MELNVRAHTRLILVVLAFLSGSAPAADSYLPLFSYPLHRVQEPVPQKSAVIITHGWNSQAVEVRGNRILADWPYKMAQQICSSPEIQGRLDHQLPASLRNNTVGHNQLIRVCQGQNWDVWIVDWMTLSGQCSLVSNLIFPCNEDPEYAFWNAAFIGDIVARYLEELGYQRLHLIAHSAGSRLIETVKDRLLSSATAPKIHMTFLDPYDPPVNETKISHYGKNAQWVDNYLDTSTLGGELSGIEDPNNTLISAANFDVTQNIDKPPVGISHSWPYKFYTKSIGGNNYLYGFPLSLEFNGSIDILSSLKSYRTCALRDGRLPCTRVVPGKPASDYDKVACNAGQDACAGEVAHQTSQENVTLARTESGFDITLTNSDNSANSNDTAGATAVFLTQFIPDGVTHVSFDYRFGGDAKSIAITTFDGKGVRMLAGSVSEGKTMEVEPVWLGDSVLEGGHSLGFVLKKLPGNGTSTLHIENVAFHRIGWRFSPETIATEDQPGDAVALKWSALRGATYYLIELRDSQGRRSNYKVLADDADCVSETGDCRWTVPTDLPKGKARWRVTAGNGDKVGTWSKPGTIQVKPLPITDVAGASGTKSGSGALSVLTMLLLFKLRRNSRLRPTISAYIAAIQAGLADYEPIETDGQASVTRVFATG